LELGLAVGRLKVYFLPRILSDNSPRHRVKRGADSEPEC